MAVEPAVVAILGWLAAGLSVLCAYGVFLSALKWKAGIGGEPYLYPVMYNIDSQLAVATSNFEMSLLVSVNFRSAYVLHWLYR